MTTSVFAWLDYSDGERRRMLEVKDCRQVAPLGVRTRQSYRR
jgi:hypothetical protein